MADNSARIAELQSLLESGVVSTSVDGTTVTQDLKQVRMELRRLRADDNTARVRRPRLSSVNLSGLR